MSLETELTKRFYDADEIRDVAKYGCSGGVSGFIYSTELYNFFSDFEEEIQDILDSYEIKPEDLVSDPNYWTFQEMREKAVWTVVELWCMQRDDDV